MPSQVSRTTIVDSILHGIEKAQNDYIKWSAGDWLEWAPEYLLTTSIARSIADAGCAITLENSVKGASKDAGAYTRGPLHKSMRPKGRVDVLVWWDALTPRAIIEVKHRVYSYAHIVGDIVRIKRMLRKNHSGSSLQFGAVAFYISRDKTETKKASNRVADILDKIESATKDPNNDLSDFNVKLYKSTHKDKHNENAWTAACLMLIPKKTAD